MSFKIKFIAAVVFIQLLLNGVESTRLNLTEPTFNSIRTSITESSIDFYGSLSNKCGIGLPKRSPRKRKYPHKTENLEDMVPNDQTNFLKRSKQNARIINGEPSKPGAWPWQVSLQLLHPTVGFLNHWCGGVLLNGMKQDLWVLTAAHCISNDVFHYPYGPMWTAVIGEHDRVKEEGYEKRVMVDQIFIHERFNEYHNDIALMKLDKKENSIFYSSRVQAVCLPSEEEPDLFQGAQCIATGWGFSEAEGLLENTLRQTDLLVLENSLCKEVYETMHNIPITNRHICAGPLNESESGTCIGDSGGPLQCRLGDGRWYLAGITSFGSGCAKPGFPDVFTKLTFYLPWIREKFLL